MKRVSLQGLTPEQRLERKAQQKRQQRQQKQQLQQPQQHTDTTTNAVPSPSATARALPTTTWSYFCAYDDVLLRISEEDDVVEPENQLEMLQDYNVTDYQQAWWSLIRKHHLHLEFSGTGFIPRPERVHAIFKKLQQMEPFAAQSKLMVDKMNRVAQVLNAIVLNYVNKCYVPFGLHWAPDPIRACIPTIHHWQDFDALFRQQATQPTLSGSYQLRYYIGLLQASELNDNGVLVTQLFEPTSTDQQHQQHQLLSSSSMDISVPHNSYDRVLAIFTLWIDMVCKNPQSQVFYGDIPLTAAQPIKRHNAFASSTPLHDLMMVLTHHYQLSYPLREQVVPLLTALTDHQRTLVYDRIPNPTFRNLLIVRTGGQ
eukprot:GILJ01005475.1.p1 GENE.GILJ01005475.1~~GILJ01005475.1.p1  ORF type:complete len:370 (+),score=49.38 GILJ01005475.1:129-1238(+)